MMKRFLCVIYATSTLLSLILPPPVESAEITGKRPPMEVVQNLYFPKSNRFEAFGYFSFLPSDNFVKMYGGGVNISYYLNERLAGEFGLFYTPDLGDSNLKNLTLTLMNEYVDYDNNDPTYYMDVTKPTLFASANAIFSPVYGKINLFGERVLNLDFSATLGVAYLLMKEQILEDMNDSTDVIEVKVVEEKNVSKPGIPLGFIMRFFPTRWLTLRTDFKYCFYLREEPRWSVLSEGGDEAQRFDPSSSEYRITRIKGLLILAFGASIFFP